MTMNFGPQHPAAHGVLRLVMEINGEVGSSIMAVYSSMQTVYSRIGVVYSSMQTLYSRMGVVYSSMQTVRSRMGVVYSRNVERYVQITVCTLHHPECVHLKNTLLALQLSGDSVAQW